jgi:hypothetical protein
MGHSRTESIRRARGSSGGHNYSRMPSQSSMKPDNSPGPQPRLRVVSAPIRSGEAGVQASPLAQLYQPLIVDDVIPEDVRPHAGTRDGVSYGPLTRRRLSSATTLQRMIPPNRDGDNVAEPSAEEQSEALWEPETTGETEEKESMLGSLEWARRLDSIEKRQERIEELLYEILHGMGGSDAKSDG